MTCMTVSPASRFRRSMVSTSVFVEVRVAYRSTETSSSVYNILRLSVLSPSHTHSTSTEWSQPNLTWNLWRWPLQGQVHGRVYCLCHDTTEITGYYDQSRLWRRGILQRSFHRENGGNPPHAPNTVQTYSVRSWPHKKTCETQSRCLVLYCHGVPRIFLTCLHCKIRKVKRDFRRRSRIQCVMTQVISV